jgi:hypothetical protein
MVDIIGTGLSLLGAATTIWELKDKISSNEPKLIIEKISVGNFIFVDDKELRRFVIARVRNVGKSLATRCIGYLASEQTIEKEYALHWADTPYAPLRNSTQPIDINPNEPRDLDIAFSLGGIESDSKQFVCTSSPTYTVTGSNISMKGTYDTYRSHIGYAIKKPSVGSWVATPMALLNCPNVSQAYLKPGSYEAIIGVSTDTAKQGDKKKIQILSAESWKNLDAKV